MNKKYRLKLIKVHLSNWKMIQVRNLTFRLISGFWNGTRRKYWMINGGYTLHLTIQDQKEIYMATSKCIKQLYSYLGWCRYFCGPWVSFVTTDEFSTRVKKLTQGLLPHELTAYLYVLPLTQWITNILSKGCKPDNFEPKNSLKLSFTNIQGLCSNFTERESFLKSNSSDILALCETNLDDTIDSSNFSRRGYLPLIRKDSTTHMHGLAV